MLETLHISNYALIESVDITFHAGFNIITGETGAGKSIMLGALSLLLGARADSKAVRQADKKSVIEATFTCSDYPALERYCQDNDIEWDDQRCILRREIAPNGRSRAFINDSPVPLSRLQEVAMYLVDIHSQHQNQLLARSDFQMDVIDTLASNADRLAVYQKRYTSFRDALRRLKKAKQDLQRSKDDEEYTRFQLEQLDALQLRTGEQTELEQEREVLANMTRIKAALYDALQALSEGPNNALDAIAEVQEAMEALQPVVSAEDKIDERLETSAIELRDIADTLSAIDSRLAGDPAQLDAVEERLNTLYTMEHKHKVESVEALIELREQLRQRLDQIDNGDAHIAELEKEARRQHALTKEAAAALTEARRLAASAFAEQLRDRAMPLGMANLRCEVEVSPIDLSPTGADHVEFRFAFNKNQPLMAVGGAASGGEISRLMLTIKAIIADKMSLPSIIFDEVDTGVSGDVANRIGQMMQDIAGSLQVTAITHLPQVAARGQHHYKVYKLDDEDATHTHIHELSPQERVSELALMLSGNPHDEAARANAEALLKRNV
ncbi:MAG: DNA repair protein RecN [Bacteroidales bacterium]|nr:DNA repair protein RecN [Bacteroidales bacterium]